MSKYIKVVLKDLYIFFDIYHKDKVKLMIYYQKTKFILGN